MTECFTKVVATKVEPSYVCECIAAYKDKILIGTKQGFILVYSVSYKAADFYGSGSRQPSALDRKIASDFCFLIRDFNKKAVTQIDIVDDFGIILSLSDGKIFVNRLTDYRGLYVLDTMKGIIRFCVDIERIVKPTGNKHFQENLIKRKLLNSDSKLNDSIINEKFNKDSDLKCRICASTKQKLSIFKWNQIKNQFKSHDKDYRVVSTPKCIQFFNDSIFFGTKTEYFLMNIETAEVNFICNVGKCQDPFAFKIADMLGIKIDETVEFIDSNGKLLTNNTLRWSFVPSSIIYHPPFTIAILNKFIEVRMVTPTILIQCLQIDNASLICRYMDRVYVMMENNKLYSLISTPRPQLVQNYSDHEDFELALVLAKTAPLVGEESMDSTKINIHYSKNLYKNREFEKAFQIFTDMIIDPANILSLFPSLCPEKIIKELKIRNWGQDFSKEEQNDAVHGLMQFLVKWRSKLRKETNNEIQCRSLFDGKFLNKPLKQLQQVVDTSLVKCYLKLKSPLVAPLLRQDNFCHLDETKKWLMSYEKYQELVLLLESHEKHEEALQLLHSQSVKTHSPLTSLTPTIQYLKNLDSNHLDLVYTYGDSILLKEPMEWLSIFTYWDHKIKNYPNPNKDYPPYKERLLRHLQKQSPSMVVPFLERMIYKLSDNLELDNDRSQVDSKDSSEHKLYQKNEKKISLISLTDNLTSEDKLEELPLLKNIENTNLHVLHTVYAEEMIKLIIRMRQPNLLCMNIKDELKSPLPDNIDVHRIRCRLKLFLQSEKSKYDASKILTELPYDALYEERAAVLARIGKHEQALTLWIHQFNNWDLAEQHCNKVYPQQSDIYYKLLSVCVEPCEPSEMGILVDNLGFSLIDYKEENNERRNKNSVSEARFSPQKFRAVEVMKKYGDKLDVSSTINLLANFVTVNDLLWFVQKALRKQSNILNQAVLLRNIQFYNKMSSNLHACVAARNFFTLTETSVCSLCGKPIISDSAVARYPNGSIVHYGCCQDLPRYTT